MLDNRVVHRVRARLDGVKFSEDVTNAVWTAIVALTEAGREIDPVTLASALDGNAAFANREDCLNYLITLDQTAATAVNIEHHADIVRSAHQRRETLAVLQSAVQGLRSSTVYDWRDATAPVPGKLSAVLESAASERMTLDSALAEFNQVLQDRFEGKVNGILTGYHSIDRLTDGLMCGEMMCLAARSGVGKTALSIGIAANVALGRNGQPPAPVVYISGELPHRQVAGRLVLNVARVINTKSVRSGRMTETEIDAYTRAVRKLRGQHIHIVTKHDMRLTMSNIMSECMRVQALHGRLGLVVIDQAPNVEADGGAKDDRFSGLRSASHGSKELAQRIDVPLIVLNQLGREVDSRENQIPRVSDIWGASEFEHAADWLGLLWRARKVNPDADRVFRVDFAKGREGEPGVAELVDRLEYGCISNPDRGGY